MSWIRRFQSISQYPEIIGKWCVYISAAIIVVSYFSKFFAFGKTFLFVYIRDHIMPFWPLIIIVAVIMLWVWVSRLHKRFVTGFSDNFTKDIRANWDFVGPWRVPEKETLLVTGSDAGGLTKVGAHWENYTFKFKARIINNCLGVVFRGQDLNNYYMIQIGTDHIVPHRRVAVPVVETEKEEKEKKEKEEKKEEIASPSGEKQPSEEAPELRPVKHIIGWIKSPSVPLNRQLNSWFEVRLIVRGESVSLYIDDNLVFQQDSFVQIPTGKVGFRNSGTETALVREVRVTLQT